MKNTDCCSPQDHMKTYTFVRLNWGYQKAFFFISTLFLVGTCQALELRKMSWSLYAKNFVKQYQAMVIPNLQLSYVDNMRAIPNERYAIENQEKTFEKLLSEWNLIERASLSEKEAIDSDIVRYEIELNLQRLSLEKEWLSRQVKALSGETIYDLPGGKRWYAYFLKRWVDIEITPDIIFEFGLSEINRVNIEIEKIEKTLPENDNVPYYTAAEDVDQAFRQAKKSILKKIPVYFPYSSGIPDYSIKRGRNSQLAHVPGFYNNNTFYYNFFDRVYKKGDIEWLLLHEAIPGHHYQLSVESLRSTSPIRQLFPRYNGFVEGWAAYVEDVGAELDLYTDVYSELGKWEWDIVRSVRVALDVGLNFYGWNDDKAMHFWRSHIENRDDIGLREIKRMKRWPAQVITYKYGADKIMKWRSHLEKNADFELINFHKRLLSLGSMPLSIMEKYVLHRADSPMGARRS